MITEEDKKQSATWWAELDCNTRTELRKQYGGKTLTAEQIDILYSQFKNKIPCKTNQSLPHLEHQ